MLSSISRIADASRYLDWLTVFRLFVLRSAYKKAFCKLKNLNFPFYHRGVTDKGVLSHFYKPGYHIHRKDNEEVKWIIDLGANIGDETVKFCIRHPKSNIVAVEPDYDNYCLLKQNVSGFGERVFPIHAGIWWRDTCLQLINGPTAESFTVKEVETSALAGRTIPSIMKEFNIPKIDILKIDIEGAEFDMFATESEQWLELTESIVVEISDYEKQGGFQNFFEALRRAGFKANCYICGENILAIREGSPLTFSVLQGTDLQ